MKISIRAYLGRGGKQQNLIDCVRNIERRFNADYSNESSVATTYARLPVKTPIHIISDTPEGAARREWQKLLRRDGNGKKLFGQIDKYGVWVKPAASMIYQGVEWDATKIPMTPKMGSDAPVR
jgi:hypothetical protein